MPAEKGLNTKELFGIHVLPHHYRQHQTQSNPLGARALVYVCILPENKRVAQQVSCYDDKKGHNKATCTHDRKSTHAFCWILLRFLSITKQNGTSQGQRRPLTSPRTQKGLRKKCTISQRRPIICSRSWNGYTIHAYPTRYLLRVRALCMTSAVCVMSALAEPVSPKRRGSTKVMLLFSILVHSFQSHF